jgi:hypothetical protein
LSWRRLPPAPEEKYEDHMAAMTDILENKYIDWFFRAQALGLAGGSAGAGTGPATLYISLKSAPDADGTPGAELSGTGYARVPVVSSLANWAGTQGAGTTTASAGSSGTTSNNNPITFGTPGAAWGQAVGFGIHDSLTGGSELYYAALGAPKTINNGDPAPSFAAGALTVTVDN